MISSATNTKLSLLIPNTNKVLNEILKHATPEQLSDLKEHKDIKTFLSSLFNDKINNTKSDALLLDLLKNNPSFKTMGNFTDNLKSLLDNLKSDPQLAKKGEKLETFIQSASTLNSPLLKEKISHSGVFMESKIASLGTNPTPESLREIERDVKSQLLHLSDDLKGDDSPQSAQLQTKIDNLITQIDYHQLQSHLNASNSLYFPFAWDGLEKGSLSSKKGKSGKFYCEINLTLKEYGDIDLMMALYEQNNLDIQIHTEKPELKKVLKENLSSLKSLLQEAELVLRNIRIVENKEILTPVSNAYNQNDGDNYTGFEVTV
ncbi:MAG: flagellar hook-length control protein FliK [Sulfuricurvum sp.]|uniref:flagellar hook-length control protein FliK n=1 Tax=Sulfuricurvum sp. TaxID=2025608 RepID=UPI002639288F|nr:flagellar hook-length control protein FliK [Sulfuricurvum sp.]MDD2829164.1 flagellar hook-length control protein FliK [Sulfuricurvum sp.]MDD4950213.1 flagellar hook-length control protein FliK [Sulfuricurvum sp.]